MIDARVTTRRDGDECRPIGSFLQLRTTPTTLPNHAADKPPTTVTTM